MKHTQLISGSAAALLVLVAAFGGCDGCGESDESELIQTSSASETGSTTLEIEPEGGSGGTGGGGGSGGAVPKKVRPRRSNSLTACCAALRHNKKSAPDAQQGNYDAAIGLCDGASKNPALLSALHSSLPKGAPAICR